MTDLKPTKVGTVNGVAFYENPVHGDEAPLMVYIDGEYRESHFWDLPSPGEVDSVEDACFVRGAPDMYLTSIFGG